MVIGATRTKKSGPTVAGTTRCSARCRRVCFTVDVTRSPAASVCNWETRVKSAPASTRTRLPTAPPGAKVSQDSPRSDTGSCTGCSCRETVCRSRNNRQARFRQFQTRRGRGNAQIGTQGQFQEFPVSPFVPWYCEGASQNQRLGLGSWWPVPSNQRPRKRHDRNRT